jgi:methionine-rich copper-binding protein CopC
MTTSRRSLYIAALVATTFLSSQAIHAAVIHVPTPTHAMFGNSKPVQFSLRNDCNTTVELKAGDQTFTVEAGKTLKVKVPAGTKIITTNATGHSEAGSLVVEVSSALNGATVAIS